MTSILPLLLITIPIGLVIAGAMLIRKRGQPETVGQRTFLFMLWSALGFSVLLVASWIFPNPRYGFLITLAPLLPALLAMALLYVREWFNLSGRQKRAIFFLIALLMGGILTKFLFDEPANALYHAEVVLQLLPFLGVSGLLFVIWKWGSRYPLIFGAIAVLYLAIFNGLEMGSFSIPSDSSLRSLVIIVLVAFAYLQIPGFVLPAIAMLVLSSLKPNSNEQEISSHKFPIAGWFLIFLLLGSLLYTYVWLWIWDGTDDGVRFILLWFATVITVASIALLIALTSSGWRRWVGLPFAGLVLALLYGGGITLGSRYSNYAITEERALRIQNAIESFHEKTGWYPISLKDLTPGEMWRIPLPMVIPGQGWCYEGGSNYYRLGLVYREHWSSPYLSVRVYASAGDFSKRIWICDQKLAQLKTKYQLETNSPPTPVPLPESTVSVPRTRVAPILSGKKFSVGDWSPDGRYLVFGQAEYFMDEVEQVTIDLYFLEAINGNLCQPPESKWTVKKSNGLSEHYAWLPDGRFMYVTDDGQIWASLPCSGEVEDLSNRFPNKFTNVLTFHRESGQVLLKDQDGLWLLNGSSLKVREIAGVPTESYRAWYAWSQDGKRLAASLLMGPEESDEAFLFIVNTETGEVEKELPLQNVSDAYLPIVEWLTGDELLLHGKTLTVMDFRSDPPKRTDLIHDVFLLDIEYPTDISSMDTHLNPAGNGYTLGLRVNRPHNQGIYFYDSKTGQVRVFEHDTHSLFFFPDGGYMLLPKWEDIPSYTDEYELVWMDRPNEERRLVVEGHIPRSQPQMFPKYLPDSSQLVFSSSQGISLVSIPDGKTLRFWEPSGGLDYYSVSPTPNEEALVVTGDGDGLYYIPLPPE